MKKFYSIYQYVALLILFPLSTWLWYREYNDIIKTLFAITMPILMAYVIPALGTNVTKLWGFNTKFKLGNFRVYHGFVFGSATNLLGYMLFRISPSYDGPVETLFFALVAGSFIAFWNWAYDIYAVQSGFAVVNNKPAYEGRSAHEIVADYAPVYFGSFGLVYGVYLKMFERFAASPYPFFYFEAVLMHILALAVPVAAHAGFSWLRHGYSGIWAYKPPAKEKKR